MPGAGARRQLWPQARSAADPLHSRAQELEGILPPTGAPLLVAHRARDRALPARTQHRNALAHAELGCLARAHRARKGEPLKYVRGLLSRPCCSSCEVALRRLREHYKFDEIVLACVGDDGEPRVARVDVNGFHWLTAAELQAAA